jgi:hypothetical protein
MKSSGASARNPDLIRSDREGGESNVAWLERNDPGSDRARVVLLGGRSAVSVRLRVSQCEARRDLEASWWSHVALVDPERDDQVLHVDLEPDGALGFPPLSNAVQASPLERFADPMVWPNIAVLGIPVPPEELSKSLHRFRYARAAVDGVELLHAWFGYLWGISGASNPLRAGIGLPSAALAEYAIGAAGFDLTPGLASRSSCPEAIWQSAVWWHEYPRPTALAELLRERSARERESSEAERSAAESAAERERSVKRVRGAFAVEHFLGGTAPAWMRSEPRTPETPADPTLEAVPESAPLRARKSSRSSKARQPRRK